MIATRFKNPLTKDNPRWLPFTYPIDWIVFFATVVVGGLFLWYIQSLGLTLYLIDQYSHLSIGRQITDSLTPGMSQVGFWPPLLHILLAPFAYFDVLYFSGFAAAALLVPVLALGVVFFSRSVYVLTDNRLLSYLSGALILLNPYVLYYAVTPMMEVLFLTALFGALYFFVHWWRYQTLASLVWLGLFVSLASMARFEGFLLLIIVGLIVVGRTYLQKRSLTEAEAVGTVFGLIAGTGVVFILLYGWTYGGSVLTFMDNSWSAYAQQRDLELPTEHNLTASFMYLSSAVVEVFGRTLLIVTILLSFLLLLVAKGRYGLYAAVLLILGSPFLFDLLALYQGSAVIYLPSLPPYPDTYFNVRYGLLALGVIIMVPILLAARLSQYFPKTGRVLSPHFVAPLFIVMLTANGLLDHTREVVCRDCFHIITNSIQVASNNRIEAAKALREQYQGGYVLMTRALNNEVAVEAGVPLRNYILEGNEHYYEQAIARPWWYAHYVVMYNPESEEFQPWMLENERVSRLWAGNELFEYYYDPVYRSDTEMVYRLDESRFRAEVLAMGLDPSQFVSLNPEAQWSATAAYTSLEELMQQARGTSPERSVEVANRSDQ